MNRNLILMLFVASMALVSCNNASYRQNSPVLPSWVDGPIKDTILKFVQRGIHDIPVEDRIAVFDMDGTIACESPLWFEMYCAVSKLNDDLQEDSSLLKIKSYQFASLLYKNPADTFVQQNWVTATANYIDSMIWKAFVGEDHESYVSYCKNYLSAAVNKDKNLVLGDLFYAPMLELISYLQENSYQVYIVSGSVQGLVWSIVPDKTTLTRQQLVGTRQLLEPDYSDGTTKFIIKKGIFTPKNNDAGKSENIYAKLGKEPVFAFGNTTGDFDMLHYAINNKHKGLGFLLDHDDSREYIYPPYHGKPEPGWREELESFGGVVVSMKNNFKNIWGKQPGGN